MAQASAVGRAANNAGMANQSRILRADFEAAKAKIAAQEKPAPVALWDTHTQLALLARRANGEKATGEPPVEFNALKEWNSLKKLHTITPERAMSDYLKLADWVLPKAGDKTIVRDSSSGSRDETIRIRIVRGVEKELVIKSVEKPHDARARSGEVELRGDEFESGPN